MARLARAAKLLVAALLVAGAATAAVIWGPGLHRQWQEDRRAAAAGGGEEVRFYKVKRQDLRLGVVEDGRLRATKHHKIRSKLKHHRAVIAWVVEEGKRVKKGEKVLEFEKKEPQERIKKMEEQLETAKRQLVVAKENLKIERSSGESAVAIAETRREGAKKALKKYRELEAPKRFKEMEAGISKARQKLADAQKALADAQRKMDEGMFVKESQRLALEKEVAGKRAAVQSARKGVAGAVLQRKMFQAYEYPETKEAKRQAVKNADLDLAKARVAAKSQMLQREDELKRVKERIKRLDRDIKEHKGELVKCVMTAPAAGMILYGDPDRRHHWGYSDGDQNKVRVGGKWWRGNTILTIPDFSKFEIDISIAEEYRGKLKTGCRALVTVEAIPDLKLDGRLKRIDSLAQPRIRWDESSPKVFKGVIELDGADERMVSGLTTRVEIVAETVKDALAVPIEAVFNEDGKPVVYLRKGQEGYRRRKVKPGKSSDDFVEILKGLEEGEMVWLIHPHRAGLEAPPGSRQSVVGTRD